MPGSPTTPGRPGTRARAPVRIAFRDLKRVGTQEMISFAAQWLACTLPCRRFVPTLADDNARLQGLSRHESTDCISDSIERLMAAIVRTYVEVDGKPAIQRTQLLGSTTEARAPDGMLYYSFSAEMRAIIRDSNISARLHKDVILQLSSKYSLALYELCRKRVNLGQRWSEEFTVERFRQLLGVGPETLPAFKSLNQRAQPAVAEVNFLCDFGCKVEPILAGRKVLKLKLSWWRKSPEELQAAKVGRKARQKGTVEHVSPPLPGIRRHTISNPETEAAAAKLLRYLGDAEGPRELLERMIELIADMPGQGSYDLPDGTEILVQPPPDLSAGLSPELEAKLQRAHYHLRRLADELKRVTVT